MNKVYVLMMTLSDYTIWHDADMPTIAVVVQKYIEHVDERKYGFRIECKSIRAAYKVCDIIQAHSNNNVVTMVENNGQLMHLMKKTHYKQPPLIGEKPA